MLSLSLQPKDKWLI